METGGPKYSPSSGHMERPPLEPGPAHQPRRDTGLRRAHKGAGGGDPHRRGTGEPLPPVEILVDLEAVVRGIRMLEAEEGGRG